MAQKKTIKRRATARKARGAKSAASAFGVFTAANKDTAMAEEVRTFREVSLALHGVSEKFGIFTKVVGGVFGIGTLVSGFFFVQILMLNKEVATLTEKIENAQTAAKDAQDYNRQSLEAIKRALRIAEAEPTKAESPAPAIGGTSAGVSESMPAKSEKEQGTAVPVPLRSPAP